MDFYFEQVSRFRDSKVDQRWFLLVDADSYINTVFALSET